MAEKNNDAYTPRLRKHYDEVVRQKLIEEFGYKNPMQVPVIEKIVINMGVGESTADSKKASIAAGDLALIAGQKPVITKARKAIATFKVREGMPIGCKVTLRKHRMYEFMDRLITIALPRVRDFPRPEPPFVRRQRQLRVGPQGAPGVPRDLLRQGRCHLGHGHRDPDIGPYRCRGTCAPLAIPIPVPAVSAEKRLDADTGERHGKEKLSREE